MASTFSSSWSVTTVPTRRRTHVERLASSSAIRMYTSYSGMRSTGGADAPSGSRFRKWVLAATPSLETLMQLLIGIVVGVLPARPSLCQPRVEAGRHESVGTLLTLGGADRDGAGERHTIVGRVGRAFVQVPARYAVARGGLDQRGVAAGIGRLHAVAEAALVGVHEHADRRRLLGHLRAGSPPGCRCGAGSPRRGTPRRRWAGPLDGSGGPRRTTRRSGFA